MRGGTVKVAARPPGEVTHGSGTGTPSTASPQAPMWMCSPGRPTTRLMIRRPSSVESGHDDVAPVEVAGAVDASGEDPSAGAQGRVHRPGGHPGHPHDAAPAMSGQGGEGRERQRENDGGQRWSAGRCGRPRVGVVLVLLAFCVLEEGHVRGDVGRYVGHTFQRHLTGATTTRRPAIPARRRPPWQVVTLPPASGRVNGQRSTRDQVARRAPYRVVGS